MSSEAERLRAEVTRMTRRVEHELARRGRVSRETKRALHALKKTVNVTSDTLFLEPRTLYDPAIVRCSGDGVLVYSADKIIDLLVEDFRATWDKNEKTLWDEAAHYFYFNIEPAHMGFFTPVYEWRFTK